MGCMQFCVYFAFFSWVWGISVLLLPLSKHVKFRKFCNFVFAFFCRFEKFAVPLHTMLFLVCAHGVNAVIFEFFSVGFWVFWEFWLFNCLKVCVIICDKISKEMQVYEKKKGIQGLLLNCPTFCPIIKLLHFFEGQTCHWVL